MPCVNSYSISWILGLLIFDVQFIHGLNVCREDLITNVKLPTELQSDVLLPCSFESDLLNSKWTTETCVVWTHLNSTNRNIVEISLDGEAKFWSNRRGRIKTFPKLLESELLVFSIQIRNVQQSDLGVYHCNLFRETGCLLTYKRIELHNEAAAVSVDSLTWPITAGAAGGAAMLVVLLVLLIVACKFFKRQANNIREPVYENTSQMHRAKFTNENRLLIFVVLFVHGLNVYREDLITNIKLPTELQSDVLLPCFFESDLLNLNQTRETCVLWTHLNLTNRNIVDISLDEEFERGESESSEDTVMNFWPFVAGGATIIIFLLVVVVCCIVHKRKKTLDQPYYANSQHVQGASKDQTIYENDHEVRKNVSKGKRTFSSVYINRPENKVALYVNSAAQADETYANCTDNDYENVE